MEIKPLFTGIVSGILLVASLTVHLLIFKGIESLPHFVDGALTAGMVLAWLLSSKFIKELNRNQPDVHPVKLITHHAPQWLAFVTAFFMLYAIINMGMMIRTQWHGSNIRGISGFWLFFYSLGVLISWARRQQIRYLAREQNQE